ncbi:MAG: tRNA pseudouridine(55) synthase TruB [Oscillospiraceae bacterium]|jgi:tRNA pseudouridine55 synthase|nr:tRNA pseudouridine(55) synthase TruB [Oscillospiraceae bacterium]
MLANAILLLDKPPDITSFGAIARVRRILGVKKAGHTGTLDPMATGVLPILLGGATRFADYLPGKDKAYIASFQLGVVTDTLDCTGNVIETHPVDVGIDDVKAALERFDGKITQTPPMYSAISKNGVRLYALARQGITIERDPRSVEITRIALTKAHGEHEYTIDVHCSAGTYIRSLIDDLGRALGCGACMTALRRTVANGFAIARCASLEQLQSLPQDDLTKMGALMPIDDALDDYPKIAVTQAQAKRFLNGGGLDLNRLTLNQALARSAYCRVYDPEFVFLGLGRFSGGELAVARILPNEWRQHGTD